MSILLNNNGSLINYKDLYFILVQKEKEERVGKKNYN